MVPAQSFLAERWVRCIPPVCGGPGTVRGRRIPCCTKVELSGANARQGKETVHLVGNCMSWWDDREGGHRLWLWGWTWLLSLSATHLNKDNDHGYSDRKLIKCLMDSADDLSSHCLVCTTSTWDYGVGPLRCSLVRGLFRHQLYLGLIAGLRILTPVVGSESASLASHVPHSSTKDKGPKFLCT